MKEEKKKNPSKNTKKRKVDFLERLLGKNRQIVLKGVKWIHQDQEKMKKYVLLELAKIL